MQILPYCLFVHEILMSLVGKITFLGFIYLVVNFAGQSRASSIIQITNTNTRSSDSELTHSSCNDLGYCRTLLNIIWSCLATIFACTWIALHPNVPAAGGSWRTAFSRRFVLLTGGLIVPELLVVWAMRQWLVARRLASDNKGMFFIPHPLLTFMKILIGRTWVGNDSRILFHRGRFCDSWA